MTSYTEDKKTLDKICAKYGCKGEIIVRYAFQMLLENGQNHYKNEEIIAEEKRAINKRHDEAEASNKILWITRDFEFTTLACAVELANVNTYSLLIYIQKEIFWSNEGGLDYQRAIDLLKRTMDWIVSDSSESAKDYDKFTNEIGFSDEELCLVDFDYLLDFAPEEEDE